MPFMLSIKKTAFAAALLSLTLMTGSTVWAQSHQGSAASHKGGGAACRITNEADSYVFAVGWQPAFCESKHDKPECQIADPKVYQATHFTLHGLWPNKTSCGANYGFCGSVKASPKSFCEYPAITLSQTVHDKLTEVMPSVSSGSCLERHEWFKHGTCQSGTTDQYYNQAVDFVHQFNEGGISKFMSEHIGQQVSLKEFLAVLNESLGKGASDHAKLGCKNGSLVDIYLNLPANLQPGASLNDLLPQAPKAVFDQSCKNGFRVAELGK
jgi:ribonuclease T2